MKVPITTASITAKLVGALFWIGAFALCVWLAPRYLPPPTLTTAVFMLGACIAATGQNIGAALRDVAKAIRETRPTTTPHKWTPEEANGPGTVR